jgi:5-methylcytosine-specific restriction protein B
MARYSEGDATAIYEIAGGWRTVCLLGGKSLLWKGENIWSMENLKEFKKHFTDNPDESQRSFEEKFKQQLDPAGPNVTKLACEIVLVYFLFPSSVSGNRKRELINSIPSWKNIKIEADGAEVLSRCSPFLGPADISVFRPAQRNPAPL